MKFISKSYMHKHSSSIVRNFPFNSMYIPTQASVIAELRRAKHARKAPWVRKFGKPSSQENLVMTSPYERTSVQTLGLGEGSLKVT